MGAAAQGGAGAGNGQWYASTAAAMLPLGNRTAQLLCWCHDERVAPLMRKVVQAAERDPLWFRAWAASGGNGPPPHDPRTGLSETEYTQYLQLMQLQLLPSGRTARIATVQRGDTVVFQRAPGSEALAGITLNLSTGVATLPEGASARPQISRVFAAEDRTGLGNRQGYVWRFQELRPDGSLVLAASLSLWRLSNSRMVLSFHRVSIVGGRPLPPDELNLMYD